MPANAYRPIIRPKGLRGTVPVEEIRKAVREVKEMRKKDPAAYQAMVKRNAHRKIIIVPDRDDFPKQAVPGQRVHQLSIR
jgi:hypothetical protein